jgi:pimeloyl-ACP methyl ester carboxylesterase
METEQFRIRSRDGRAQLTGQVDLPPNGAITRNPVVLMVPGGWFMDRDGYMGGSGTERDLVYRDLANDLLRAGIAVVRYDNRGVRCNEMTMPCCPADSNELEISRHYLNACVDADVRQSVTTQTQMDDVEDIWVFAAGHPKLDARRVLVWAHSEGGLNVARLLGKGRIDPQGVQFVGAITESPAAVFRWQTIERYVEHVMDWDDDGDGCITQTDIDRHLPGDQMFEAVGISSEVLAAPRNGWNQELLHERFAAEYEKMRTNAFAKPDDAPYPDPSPELRVVAASNNWWKQWFVDETPLIDRLAGSRSRAIFHIGELDSQNPASRQQAFGEARIKTGRFAIPPRLVLHKGRGHSLRTGEPVIGPMDEAAKACLVTEARELLFPS